MDLWQIVEIIGAVVGLVYLWLEYRASIWLWVVGIIMPAIYIYVYYRSGIYANMGINIYYLVASIYGLFVWMSHRGSSGGSKEEGESESLPISRTPRKVWLPAMVWGVVFFVIIAWILTNFTDSDVPYVDGFTTGFSIVALWMLTRKYAEQWLLWLVVDGIASGLYFYKGLYPTAILFTIYAVISVFGYRKWLRMIKEQDAKAVTYSTDAQGG